MLSDQAAVVPTCPCGETRLTYVKPRRMPRFVGACTGPYAESRGVEPATVDVAPGGPLRLKDPAAQETH